MKYVYTTFRNRLFSSLILGLALLSSALPAQAQVSLYIVAKGDTLWSIASEQLQSPHDWKRLMEYNEMSDSTQLQVGHALRIPNEWMKKTFVPGDIPPPPSNLPIAARLPAGKKLPPRPVLKREGAQSVKKTNITARTASTVVARYGNVELIKGKNVSELPVNAKLEAKSRIQTGPRSGVNILLKDGSMLVLLSNTELVLGQPLELIRGGIELNTDISADKYMVSTKAGAVKAKKAGFRVTALDNGNKMRVEVTQGAVTVEGDKKQRSITTGIAMQIEAGKPMKQPRQGLMRPDIANLSKRSVNNKVRLRWPPIAGAAAYRAQLVYARDTYLVLYDEKLTQPELTWTDISPGRYKIRLRSVDEQGLEGLDSEIVFYVQGTIKAPMSTTPKDGSTLPTNTPWIAWSRVMEANTYVLQVANDANFSWNMQEFNYQVNNYYKYTKELPAGEYYWRVKSVSPKGVESPFGETRMFKIK